MKAGKLDTPIEILRHGPDTIGPSGNPTKGELAVIANMRGQRLEASTDEFIRGYGESDEITVTYRMRYISGLKTSDVLRAEGVEWDIEQIKPIGRNRGLEIRCKERKS